MRARRFIAVLVSTFALTTPDIAIAQKAEREGLVEEATKLAATLRGSKISFDSLIVRPDGAGPYPLAVVTHGAVGDYTRRAAFRSEHYAAPAREMARRGWAVVVFLRLGYGPTGGEPIDAPLGGCSGAQYEDPANATAIQMRAAIEAARALPYVDSQQIIAMGVSAGGFGVLALAAQPPEGLRAVVNFAGGRGSNEKGEVCRTSELNRVVGIFGGRSRIPTLWIYAENDRWFIPAVARGMHQAFTSAGGKAEILFTPPSGEDGHGLMSRQTHVHFWAPALDAFLRQHNLRTWSADTLRLDRIGAPARLREDFEKYLAAPTEKAWATAPSGASGWRSTRTTTEDARRGALENCSKSGAKDCRVVVVNFDVSR